MLIKSLRDDTEQCSAHLYKVAIDNLAFDMTTVYLKVLKVQQARSNHGPRQLFAVANGGLISNKVINKITTHF